MNEENFEAWEILIQFPGILKSGMSGITVDYTAAIYILEKAHVKNPLELLQKFEALKRGYAIGRQ